MAEHVEAADPAKDGEEREKNDENRPTEEAVVP
jgi:hypothetical protein